jgi:phosphoribosylaminoimidazole carboxylase (NCAIR synthetase)
MIAMRCASLPPASPSPPSNSKTSPSSCRLIEDEGVPVRPNGETLSRAQDRLAEKTFFREIGIEPAPFARIDHPDQIQEALTALGGSGVLKSRFAGYDGKGQVRLKGNIQPYPHGRSRLENGFEAWIEHAVKSPSSPPLRKVFRP